MPEGFWDCFSANIVGAVDIGIDSLPGACPIEPAMLAFAGKGVLLA